MSLLKVTDLNIEFHDHLTPETVVYDFDLELQAGEIVGIVGESGSGKTMSALAIAGLLRRHDMKKTGEILFDGVNLLTCERSRLRKYQGNDISMVFQEPMTSLNPVKKIGWQVEESLRIHTALTKEERYQKTIQALKNVELEHPEKIYEMYPHQLSGGMRQRVMIAAAMICEPKILIADEPTTALDVTIQAQIVKLLKKINKEQGTAILFISHDLSLVKRLCERVMVMQGGYVVESGQTDQIFYAPQQEYTKKLIAAIPECTKKESKLQEENNVLSIQHLDAYYNDEAGKTHKKIQVLHDISMEIKEGEILGLVGESGCGKTTLAKTILSMTKDYKGQIICCSKYPQMVFQDPYGSLNPAKKIGWILEEPLKNRTHMNKQEREEKVVDMLNRVGLNEKYRNHYPDELSGGQRQRVCIAEALMLSPELLIADEAVSALDVTIQAQIVELLLKLHKEMGIAILFISHDLRIVYQICNRVIIMKEGRIIESGDTQLIYSAPKEAYTKELLACAGI